MNMRIDLSAAPSAMETLAASWANRPKAQPVRSQPDQRAAPYRPQVFAKPDIVTLPPQRVVRKPQASAERPLSNNQEQITAQVARQFEAELRSYLAPPEPDPASYAANLPFEIAEALIGATRCTAHDLLGNSEVPDNALLPELRARGLVYFNNRCLSIFAREVRKVLLKDRG
jgi:hypothetical protein